MASASRGTRGGKAWPRRLVTLLRHPKDRGPIGPCGRDNQSTRDSEDNLCRLCRIGGLQGRGRVSDAFVPDPGGTGSGTGSVRNGVRTSGTSGTGSGQERRNTCQERGQVRNGVRTISCKVKRCHSSICPRVSRRRSQHQTAQRSACSSCCIEQYGRSLHCCARPLK